MAHSVTFSEASEHDFEQIFDFLYESYTSFGEEAASARQHAAQTLGVIFEDIHATLTNFPHRGTRRDEVIPGVRQLPIKKATIWFTVHDEMSEIRILAVFYGSQDQERRMLLRALEQNLL